MAFAIVQTGALGPLFLVYAVALGLLGNVLWTVVYNLFLSPLSKFPGPKLAAISHIPFLYWGYTGNNHKKMKEFHDKYGDVVRMAPSTLVYRSPQAWKDIYGHRKSLDGPFEKDPRFSVKGPYGASMFSADDEGHSRTRKLMSHAFSEKALRDQEDLIQSYVDLLVNRLEGETFKSQEPTDMVRWYNFTTFDIIGDLTFGEPFNCLQNNVYHQWVSMTFQAAKGMVFIRPIMIYPLLAPIVRKLLPKQVMKNRLEHYRMTEEKVLQRIKTKTERPDFFTFIMRHSDDRAISVQQMKANAALLILAGSETAASVLSGFTYYLLQNEAAHQKLLKELRETFKFYDEINFKCVSGLKYLNAALEEALRMFPPLTETLPRVVPKGGAMIDGEYVPEGVSVGGAHYSTYRAESLFTDAESFIPERWLDNRDERFESDNRAALTVWSLGPRNCLGKNLAYAEMRLIIAKVFWSFDMKLDGRAAGWDNLKSYNQWEKTPLPIHLSKAQH
ncbi:Cytochrome monooxygenase lcsI [Penicillium pulvis]|uniref:Cytochrome monooxygenase lcsI n=1 Tax=Penicillium pulvis TaxID=1562058 RepID=UPI0025469EDA|nr:Cytochrome monooxygenase lcsI [Penicillium pulvis]KAJ5806541.1 Cytochrome monooxygenase lcsI [Penicillium pulvis]